MKKQCVYKYGNDFYRKVKDCTGRYEGMSMWQPMKKVLWFFVPDRNRSCFILDSHGFRRICTK